MIKSPEEYLSGMDFGVMAPEPGHAALDAGERVFVEKYLGLDALGPRPPESPEPMLQLMPAPQPAPPLPVKDREIVVARELRVESGPTVAPAVAPPAVAPPVLEIGVVPEVKIVVEAAPQDVRLAARERLREAARARVKAAALKQAARLNAPQSAPVRTEAKAVEKPLAAQADKIAEDAKTVHAADVRLEEKQSAIQEKVRIKPVEKAVAAPAREKQAAQAKAAVVQQAAAAPETKTEGRLQELARDLALREKLKQETEIQVVSFFVAEQLFLLPVAGIQEVVRHIELIKVPQAPQYIAGAMNLRGTVMPLIHLSALLTNASEHTYDKKKFVIVTGADSLRMGLIIDRVSSMHMIPQNKIIWNAESKLGDSAEFLSAIVDLNDRVCGMIAPEIITQKILPDFPA